MVLCYVYFHQFGPPIQYFSKFSSFTETSMKEMATFTIFHTIYPLLKACASIDLKYNIMQYQKHGSTFQSSDLKVDEGNIFCTHHVITAFTPALVLFIHFHAAARKTRCQSAHIKVVYNNDNDACDVNDEKRSRMICHSTYVCRCIFLTPICDLKR